METTEVLDDNGAPRDTAELLLVFYDELRRLARAHIARLAPGQTLTPTELVHEAYLRVRGKKINGFEGRRHFFFTTCRAMRDVLVEDARRKTSLKRGGDYLRRPGGTALRAGPGTSAGAT